MQAFVRTRQKSITSKLRNTINNINKEDKRTLLDWYLGLDITPPEVKWIDINFGSITISLGRTNGVCYIKLKTIISSGVLDQEEIDALFSRLPG